MCVHMRHTRPKNWSDVSLSGRLAPVSRRERLIILHVGGYTSSIPDAQFLFKSNQKTGDYHIEMNSENYIRWLKEKLFPSLNPDSLLLMDNTSYDTIQKDKVNYHFIKIACRIITTYVMASMEQVQFYS